MYPGKWAQISPDKPAAIQSETGAAITHRQLDDRSNRLAQLMWDRGLRPGDHVALFTGNDLRFFEVMWAALRSGLYVTPVNRYLTADEAGYIVDDCDAKLLVASGGLAAVAADLPARTPKCETFLAFGGAVAGFEDYEAALAGHPAEPLAREPLGAVMFYSSGTTGWPKGVKHALSGALVSDDNAHHRFHESLWGFGADTVFLSPAPLYHAAPGMLSLSTQALGGTAVVMPRFEPGAALHAIEHYRVNRSQWVPTMFIRMLKMPEDERLGYDLSSHQVAIHAAAPCPVEVKQRMLDWWGPIIHEYYAGTEANGSTHVGPEEWLAHPGTVGRPMGGEIHICDDAGNELPTGEAGVIYFQQAGHFNYHKDAEKTRRAEHPDRPDWTALGDIGYLDEDGYLYLIERKSFMIISGGVNIYPQETEDVLVGHPRVLDVGVIGVPDPDMGEEVKAVVQLMAGVEPGPRVEAELIAYARERLAHYKCPKSIDFVDELPRLPTGKLYKSRLRERYWPNDGDTLT